MRLHTSLQLNRNVWGKFNLLLRFESFKEIKTSGSESRPRKVELASAHKKRHDYREYFTHNNEACKNPYKTTLPHLYIH